jgi:hypothetical protein
MNIPNAQRPKVSARLRGHKSTLDKSKSSVVQLVRHNTINYFRKRHQSQLPVRHYLDLALQIKERILKPRIVNVPVFSLEQNDLNDPLNDFVIPNG